MEYFKNGYRYTINNGIVVSKKKIKKKQFFKNKKKESINWNILVSKCKNLSYDLFLKSDYWKEVRKIILKRDKFKCTVCGSKELLSVHHSTYKNHFKEHLHLKDLHTLCDRCHYEFHCIK